MFTPVTLPALSVTMTAEEWRAVLVDPSAFQDELRAALAAQRADADERTTNLSLRKNGHRVDGDSIARAAKRQNKKVAKRFLAQDAATFSCEHCEKVFNKAQFLNIHKARMHKAELGPIVQTAVDASRA